MTNTSHFYRLIYIGKVFVLYVYTYFLFKHARQEAKSRIISDVFVANIFQVLRAQDLKLASILFEKICYLYLSKSNNNQVEEAKHFLEQNSKNLIDLSHYGDFWSDFEDMDDTELPEYEPSRKGLRSNSSFYKYFSMIQTRIQSVVANFDEDGTPNPFYCPELVTSVTKQYLRYKVHFLSSKIINVSFFSLFPLISASLTGQLYTNAHIELYWRDSRQMMKEIPDRLRWPNIYLGNFN